MVTVVNPTVHKSRVLDQISIFLILIPAHTSRNKQNILSLIFQSSYPLQGYHSTELLLLPARTFLLFHLTGWRPNPFSYKYILVLVSLSFPSLSFITLSSTTCCHWLSIPDCMLSFIIWFSHLWVFFFPPLAFSGMQNVGFLVVCLFVLSCFCFVLFSFFPNVTVLHFVSFACTAASVLRLFPLRSAGSSPQTSVGRKSKYYFKCKFSPKSAIWRMTLRLSLAQFDL